MENLRFCTGLGAMGTTPDRFIPGGYHRELLLDEMLKVVADIPDIRGVELFYPDDFQVRNVKSMRSFLRDIGLVPAIVELNTSTRPEWVNGTITNPDEKLRSQIMDYLKKGVDEVAELGCDKINLWLGLDGYDYPLQVNYSQRWDLLLTGLKELALHNSDIKICLEYKQKEPFTHLHVSTVGKALTIVKAIDLPNLGVNIDVGHGIAAYEDVAESVVFLNHFGKLFHLHLNDNFRYWDDDLVPGSVHFWEFIELMYWLNEIQYKGWFSLDIWPSRTDRKRTIIESIENLKFLASMASKLDRQEMEEIFSRNDALKSIRMLRKIVSG